MAWPRTSLTALVAALIAIVALAVTAAPTSPSAGTHPDLVQLAATNWSSNIQQGAWLIEFYSPYCRHCKAFLPLWKELSNNKQSLSTDYPDAPFRMAQVNCYAQRQLCVDEEVPHFPKLTLYMDGKRSSKEYQGDREYTELANWIEEEAHYYRSLKQASNTPHPVKDSQQPVMEPVVKPQPQPERPAQPKPIIEAAPAPAPAPASPPDVKLPGAPSKADAEAVVAAPPPPPPDSAPEPAASPPPQPAPAPVEEIDWTLPNPRGQLLQFGISEGVKTVIELRNWLGIVPSHDEEEADKGSHGAAAMMDNDDEGSHGTGSTSVGGGHGGAHLIADHDKLLEETIRKPSPDSNINTRLPLRKDSLAKGGTFVKFFAPWCPHCKAMAKSFEQLAPALKNRLNVLEVDCEAHRGVCRAFGIQSYPTLRLYSPTNRVVSEYRGSRSFDAMLKWCSKAAEEEGVDLPIANDEGHWADISRKEEVRFLWLTDGSDLDSYRGVEVPHWEEERDLVTAASRGIFTSPFRVYRSSHGALAGRFESWFGARHGGFRSVVLAFKDRKADRPVDAFHVMPAPPREAERPEWRRREQARLAEWLDWNRYPTLSQVGGDSWVDVVNNRHGAPVALALLSDEHHDGETYPTGTGSARREAEVAALKRMALAWRDGQHRFAATNGSAAAAGGLLWGWIDADRWRQAIGKYYNLRNPADFPGLILVDGPTLQWWPLPTQKPSRLIDVAQLDPPPAMTLITGEVKPLVAVGGEGAVAPGAGGSAAVKEYKSKLSYAGESREVSTWLGSGAAAAKQQDGIAAAASSEGDDTFIDDLGILVEIEAIGRGERKGKARSSRSYIDRSYRRIGSFVSFGARHPFMAMLFLFALLGGLLSYVRRSQRAERSGLPRYKRMDDERDMEGGTGASGAAVSEKAGMMASSGTSVHRGHEKKRSISVAGGVQNGSVARSGSHHQLPSTKAD